MGDHRSMSADSRSHLGDSGNGTVPADKVIGRAFVVVWPLDRIGTLPAPQTSRTSSASAAPAAPGAIAIAIAAAVPAVRIGRRPLCRPRRDPAAPRPDQRP
jgi:signal peptidase I